MLRDRISHRTVIIDDFLGIILIFRDRMYEKSRCIQDCTLPDISFIPESAIKSSTVVDIVLSD